MTAAFEIGPFRLVPDADVLTRDGIAAPLGPRAVGVLKILVEHANEYVSKAQIIDGVWRGSVVEEGNLPVQIAAIRRVLEQGGGEHWIETLPRRGYRFVGPVSAIADDRCDVAGGNPPNLPAPFTSFIGREHELAEAKRLLSRSRLLTIAGIGGIGKTRLALKVAADVAGAYRDGAWFVDLGSLADPALVPAAVAQALRMPESRSKSITHALCHHLAGRELLVILDNCEHVLDGSAPLAVTLLEHAAMLTILATSREPLQVAGEQTYILSSLSLPDPGAETDAIGASDAVRLFFERAQRHQPGFELTPVRAKAVAQLCIHLDGIPLALELAAARIRSLSIEQIHARLDDRFRLLTAGGRSALPRQQTLRATLDWSFDLLSEEERAVLRRLAVFSGGFTLEAAGAVACDASNDPHAVTDLLGQLVLRSLVIADVREKSTRYRLLETTRAYALQKLAESDETATSERRHAEHYRDRFKGAPDDLLRMSDTEWDETYRCEIDNVRGALAWAFGPTGDPDIGIQLVASGRPLWSGLPKHEGENWLRTALDRVTGSTSRLDEARLWVGLGTLLHTIEPAESTVALEHSVAMYRGLHDPPGLGRALVALGRVYVFMGRFEQATAALAEAFPLVEREGLPKPLARYFETVAFLRMLTGDLANARTHFEKALELYRSVGAGSSAGVLLNLADMTWALGDLDGALVRFGEAVALIRNSPGLPRDMLGHGLTNLAGVYTERGDLVKALAAAKEGVPLRRGGSDIEGALDHLALRAALAGGVRSAARLAGYLDHKWMEKNAKRQPNEVRARGRLQTLLQQKLATEALESLLADGATLNEEQACRLALDAAPDAQR